MVHIVESTAGAKDLNWDGSGEKKGTSGKWVGQSQELCLEHQASGSPITHRIAATPALGEGDADAAGPQGAGNGFWHLCIIRMKPKIIVREGEKSGGRLN